MSRAAANNAQQTFNTSSKNSNQLFGSLAPEAQNLINSPGFDPNTLSAITNQGEGAVNSAFGGAAGNIARGAARTKNPAGVSGELDALALDKGIAGGKEAGDIAIQNYGQKKRDQTQGLGLESSLYGANMGQEVPSINAETQASPGWAQTLGPLLNSIGGQFNYKAGGGSIGGGRG